MGGASGVGGARGGKGGGGRVEEEVGRQVVLGEQEVRGEVGVGWRKKWVGQVVLGWVGYSFQLVLFAMHMCELDLYALHF